MEESRVIIVNGVKVTCYEDGSIEKINRRNGRLMRTFGTSDCNKGYLRVNIGGKQVTVHRMIARAFLSDWNPLLQVDHIWGIKTDNRPAKLRMATNSQNHRAAKMKKFGCTSLLRGVWRPENSLAWVAYCYIDRKQIRVGTFNKEWEAGIARDVFAFENGFAVEGLNFPELFM